MARRQLHAVLVLMAASSSPFSTAALFVASSAWQTVSKEFYRMKKSLVSALLAVAMACCATALYAQQDNMSQSGQPQGHHMMSPEQRLQHMTKMLNLTPEQQEKIKPILENQSTQMQSLHQDTSMSRDDKMAKAQQLRQTTDEQIKGILTPEQQQKWSEMQARHQGNMGEGHGPVVK
jgi:periplasmic protein CpxP/Spy